jgi:N-acetylglutamate synthase-like GNAT family acetyltransferase
MAELLFSEFDPGDPKHNKDAEEIGRWTQGAHMLPLTPKRMGEHVLGLLAYEVNEDGGSGELAGYRAVTEDYGDGAYEIGALVINPDLQGRGYGSRVAAAIVLLAQETFPGARFIVFCNPQSEGISRRLGFTNASREDVPDAALSLCAQCPKYSGLAAGQACCDAILALNPQTA